MRTARKGKDADMKATVYSLFVSGFLLAGAACSTPEGPLERTGRTVDRIGRNTARSVETGVTATGRTLKKGGQQVGHAFE